MTPNTETVAFLSLAKLDRCTLRQKHSDCADDWVICELCVRQARPNPFFGSTSSQSATSTNTTTAATTDRQGTSHDTQIGYLLAMVNGDVNHRIPQWALVLCCTLCLWVHYPAGEWLDSKISRTQLFFVVCDCVQCMSSALVMLRKKHQKKRQKRQKKRQKRLQKQELNLRPFRCECMHVPTRV